MTSAHLLNAAGTYLFGPQWQSELARQLNINLRTMHRWAKGEFEPRDPNLWADLDDLVLRRQLELDAVRRDLIRKRVGLT